MSASGLTPKGFARMQEANWTRIEPGVLVEMNPQEGLGFRFALVIKKLEPKLIVVIPFRKKNIQSLIDEGVLSDEMTIANLDVLNVYAT